MKRLFAVSLACLLASAQLPPVYAQLDPSGVIAVTVRGARGPLAGATVQAIDAAGAVAGTGLTNAAGAFNIGKLRPGAYMVQVLGSNRRIIGVASARLTDDTMAVSVTIVTDSGNLAAPATEVAAATGSGSSARVVLAGVGAAAAALGTLAVISTQEDVSGSR
jgi:hypothetical protein